MYSGLASCSWNITVPPSEQISLHFVALNTGDCHNSRVTVQDDTAKDVVGVYCGHKAPSVVRTIKSHLLVQFVNEGPPGGRFRMNYNTGRYSTSFTF